MQFHCKSLKDMEQVSWGVCRIAICIPQRKGDAKDVFGMYHTTPALVPGDDLNLSCFQMFFSISEIIWKYYHWI